MTDTDGNDALYLDHQIQHTPEGMVQQFHNPMQCDGQSLHYSQKPLPDGLGHGTDIEGPECQDQVFWQAGHASLYGAGVQK